MKPQFPDPQVSGRSAIDDILGPARSRYFGEGFKGVRRVVNRLELKADDRSLEARVGILYPPTWSMKERAPSLAPHLSTLDAIYLSSWLGEWLLCALFDMSQTSLPVNVRRFEVKAGAIPHEALDDLPISMRIEKTEKTVRDFHPYRSVVAGEIAGMTVLSEFEHGGIGRDAIPESIRCAIADEASLPLARECRLSMAIERRQSLDAIEFDDMNRKVKADFMIQGSDQRAEFITPIEVVCALAQLAQVLIYKTDGLHRSKSDTLWMRQVLYEGVGYHRPTGRSCAEAWIDSDKSIRKGGEHWRLYRMLGQLGSSRGACMVTHRLP